MMNDFQLNIYVAALGSFIFSYFLNQLSIKFSKNLFFSKNKDEIRLSHKNIPPVGGVAISFVFLIFVRLLGKVDDEFLYVAFFAVLISVMGVLDDFFNLSWKLKLIFQIVFVFFPIYHLQVFFNIENVINLNLNNNLNIIFSIFWIVLIINSINFIDNMDGLAVVISTSIGLQILIFSRLTMQYKITDISILLIFSVLGFFIFNFPPAKIYLGDSGSLFIGFCLGFLSIFFIWNQSELNIISFALNPIFLFFTIPLLDFAIVLEHRLSNGKSPFKGGTDHISHRLINLGYSQTKVLIIFFIYSIFCFLIIYLNYYLSNVWQIVAVSVYLIQIVFFFRYLRKLEPLQNF